MAGRDKSTKNKLKVTRSMVEKGDIKLGHNAYDLLGKTLLHGIKSGRLDPNKLNNLALDLGINLGRGYGLNIGRNQYIGDRKQDLKLTIKKRF